MKKRQRYITYISIPVLLVLAIVVYNSFYSDVKMGDDAISSGPKGEKSKRGGGDKKSLPVSVYIADLQKSEDGLTLPGTLVARERVEMASELTGRVVSINFKRGSLSAEGRFWSG